MSKFLKWTIAGLFVLMIIIMIAANVRAEPNWSGSVSMYRITPTDSEKIVQSGQGFQANLHYKDFFLYGSKDVNPVRFGGQSGIDINIYSAGFGFQRKINDRLKFFFDVGWYEPRHDTDKHDWPETCLSEGLWMYLNDKLQGCGYTWLWDYYTIEYSGAIGGKIGVSYNRSLFKNASFQLSTSYRHLKLREMVKGKDYGRTDGWWEYKIERPFSGWIIAANITYNF